MKKLVVIVTSLILGINSAFAFFSQKSIIVTGVVVDSEDGKPMEMATVSLRTSDGVVTSASTTDANGVFKVGAESGKYIFEVSFMGYKDYVCDIILEQEDVDLGEVPLDLDLAVLQSASITERVKLVEVKLDKVVMKVSQSAFSSGSNALELMKKAPGVTIDKDGNVKLNGKSVSIWIDGRPSYMDGKSLEALLRSTNSESIEKFELMEHPSAKYDASGQGGIINIKTKRNFLQGLNASMGLSGGGMYFSDIDEKMPWQEGVWVNLSYRTPKISTFLSLYEGIYNTPVRIVNDMMAMDSPLGINQKSISDFRSRYCNYNMKFSTDWFIDKKNTAGFIFYMPGDNSDFNSTNSLSDIYSSSGLSQHTVSGIKNRSKSLQQNINLNYTHVFDEQQARELTANLDYYHNLASKDNVQDDTLKSYLPIELPLKYSRKLIDSKNQYNIYSAKADYQGLIFGKFLLESGAKWALSKTDNNCDEVFIPANISTPDKLTIYTYSENIGAVYASIAGQLSPKFSFKVGLRGEYTNSYGDWKSGGTKTKREYVDWFPTVYAGYVFSDNCRLSASYSRRIDRPHYDQLNPTKTYIDSKTYTIGNPDMLPQYTDNVSLSSAFGQYFTLALTYGHTKNLVSQIAYYGDDGTQYLAWGNLGKSDMGVISANIASLPLGKYLQWTLSANGLYINTQIASSGVARASLAASAYTSFSFLLPSDWKMDLDVYYSTPMEYGGFLLHSRFGSNFAIKKNFFSDRMVLTLRLDDIFRSSNNNLDVLDGTGKNVVTSLQQIYYAQKVVVDLTFNFGKSQKPLKQRRVGGLEEMSRASGGGGIRK